MTVESVNTSTHEKPLHRGLPPGSKLPVPLQLAQWISNPVGFMQSCFAQYGEMFTVRLPTAPPFVFVSDPALIREIFTGDPEVLYAGEGNQVLRAILGEYSLLLLDGTKHQRERKMMMPPFHGERMRAYGEAMRSTALQAFDAWPEEEPVTAHSTMQSITLDVILRTVFGLQEGQQLDEMRERLTTFMHYAASPMGTLLTFLLPPSIAREVLTAGSAEVRLGPLSIDPLKALPWGKLVRAGMDVDNLLYSLLAARRKTKDAEQGEDVLSMLLAARDETGAPMTDQQLRDEMITLLLAGHETSATTLSWAIHYLLEYPAVRDKAVAEVDRVTGGQPLDPEQVGKLEYLDALLKEAQRLTPIIPVVARVLQRPFKLGAYELPKGTGVMPCIYLAQHHPDHWKDPERFDPERFLEGKINPFAYFPFGGGTRRCLGAAFATYEMKIVLAELLRTRTLRASNREPVRLVRRGITFAPSGGVQLFAKKRA